MEPHTEPPPSGLRASFSSPSKPPARGEAPDPSVREPWQTIQKKVSAPPPPPRLSEKSEVATGEDLEEALHEDDLEELEDVVADLPPPSGVRSSAAPLSYAVYTLADLEARRSGELRMSSVSPPSRQAPWRMLLRTADVLTRAFVAWARTPARSHERDALDASARAFAEELHRALLRLDWKKVGIGAAIGVGIFGVLLVGVFTAAELTDDLKPVRSAASSSPAIETALPAAIAPAPESAAAEPEPEPEAAQIEIIAPSSPKAARAKGKAKGSSSEVFIP